MNTVAIGPFKVGEKPAPLIYTFLDANGNAINITGYTVKFIIREREALQATATQFNAVLLNGPLGQVQYTWTGVEFPVQGHYLAEFWVGNNTQRFGSVTMTFDVAASVGAAPAI